MDIGAHRNRRDVQNTKLDLQVMDGIILLSAPPTRVNGIKRLSINISEIKAKKNSSNKKAIKSNKKVVFEIYSQT